MPPTQNAGERMIETTAPWLVLYSVLGYFIVWGICATIKENYGQTMYWRGRKDGFDMHRRITDSKTNADNN